jgi:catechol 2,3-dioxygenase-like lactoylglutathione lyase family enzyme
MAVRSIGCAIVVLAVLIGVSARAAPENPIPEGFKVAPMSRATILVRNQEESLKLYRDVLGLRVRVDRNFDDERFNRIMGIKGRTIKVKILQSGDTVYGNVGLFELAGPSGQRVPPAPAVTFSRPGDVAVVFMTNDIDGIAAKVKTAGYPIISPPMVLFPRDDMEVQAREMLFRDRDGVLVNLIQSGRPKAH